MAEVDLVPQRDCVGGTVGVDVDEARPQLAAGADLDPGALTGTEQAAGMQPGVGPDGDLAAVIAFDRDVWI